MKKSVLLILAIGLGACSTGYNPLQDYEQRYPATQLDPPVAGGAGAFAPDTVERGRYLVGLLGCGSCHTDGALVGTPDTSRLLAGSNVGIAWTNPLEEPNPGIVYPSNLTPDPATGIGDWSVQDIVTMLRTGVARHAGQTLPVMPWPSYADLHSEDAEAIAAYLLSLPPVRHQVPANVAPGRRARAPFVHFGVYQSLE